VIDFVNPTGSAPRVRASPPSRHDLLRITGAFAAPRSPECSHDNVVIVEGVVEVKANLSKVDTSKTDDAGLGVGRTYSGEDCQDLESLFELSGEDVCVSSVPKPPGFSRLTCSCAVLVNRTRRGVNAI
jgi:hypothetical protein